MKGIVLVILAIALGVGDRGGVWTEQEQKKEEPANSQRDIELNTLLMGSTFMLIGQSKEPGKVSFAAGFLIGRPEKKNPQSYRVILITAAHVLEGFQGAKATIVLRKQKEDGLFEKVPFEFQIIDNTNKPLWVRYPDKDVDVAAMYISLPPEVKVSLVSTSLLGDDRALEKFEIHPGDELLCLGFPLGVQSAVGGFPILRSGKIASYPLIPAKKVRKIYYDFHVYDGNSGGPVYFTQTGRYYENTVHVGETIHFIVGLVSAQALAALYNNQPVSLAEIVPAQFIVETLAFLPEQEK